MPCNQIVVEFERHHIVPLSIRILEFSDYGSPLSEVFSPQGLALLFTQTEFSRKEERFLSGWWRLREDAGV